MLQIFAFHINVALLAGYQYVKFFRGAVTIVSMPFYLQYLRDEKYFLACYDKYIITVHGGVQPAI
jgi:hypothetical protein